MNWASAWVSMLQGFKVRRRCWGKTAYWKIAGGEVLMHGSNGEDLNFREVSNMANFLGVLCCDDWEVVRDEVPEDVPD